MVWKSINRVGLSIITVGVYDIVKYIVGRGNNSKLSTHKKNPIVEDNGFIYGSFVPGVNDCLTVTLDERYKFKVKGENGVRRITTFSEHKSSLLPYVKDKNRLQLPRGFMTKYISRELGKLKRTIIELRLTKGSEVDGDLDRILAGVGVDEKGLDKLTNEGFKIVDGSDAGNVDGYNLADDSDAGKID